MEYVRLHHAIARSIDQCAPVHKAYSIDEWAIRLGSGQRAPKPATDLACQIKSRLRKDFSKYLTCSIGIASTRLLAKIASDMQGPDGLTVLQAGDLPERLEYLPLQSLCGIGEGLAARFEQRGIRSIRDLWNLDRTRAVEDWGSTAGARWWAGLHGHDEPEIPTRRRSMSHASVLDPRFRNDPGARGILIRLVCRLGVRLRTDGYVATALRMEVSDLDGAHFSTAIDLPYVQDTPSLLTGLYTLWDRRKQSHARPIKVGAVVSGLVPASQVSGHLFAQVDRSVRLSHAMDSIQRRWGHLSIYVGAMHRYRQPMDDKIAFGRMPSVIDDFRPDDARPRTHPNDNHASQ